MAAFRSRSLHPPLRVHATTHLALTLILALTVSLGSLPAVFQDVTILVNNAGLAIGLNAADGTPMDDVTQVHTQDTQWVPSCEASVHALVR